MEKKYEACFLFKAELSEEETGKEVAFIEEKIATGGGKTVSKEFWGKKRLAYPIKKRTDEIYYIFYFKASPNMILPIEQPLRRRENILRYLFIERKRLPEAKEETNAGANAE